MPDIDNLSNDLIDNDEMNAVPVTATNVNVVKPVALSCAKVTSEYASLSRMIKRGCYVDLPDIDASLALHLAEHADVNWSDTLSIEGAFGSIEIFEGARLLRAIGGIDLSEELNADEERWEWMQSALVGRLSSTPFASADRIGRTSLEETADPDTPRTSLHTLRITLRTGHHVITTHARAEASVWIEFLQSTSWMHERLPISHYIDLPFETSVRIAQHKLPAHALRTVAAGDLILPDSPYFQSNGKGSIRIGPLFAQVRYQAPGTLHIISVEGKLDSYEMDDDGGTYGESADEPRYSSDEDYSDEHDDESEYASESDDDHDDHEGDDGYEEESEDETESNSSSSGDAGINQGELDRTPVTLEFELGKVKMTLGDVRTLGVGTIVPFTGGSPAVITIMAAGRSLGRGEVVDVDGQLGIRIIQWGATS